MTVHVRLWDTTKNLKDNGFFEANHSLTMNAKDTKDTKEEIKTEVELIIVIKQEKDGILKNAELTKSFNDIDKKLDKNKDVNEFREYLDANKEILPELDNLPLFKEKLWIAYLINSVGAYKSLMDIYVLGKEEIEKILDLARKEETKWVSVINIFNERFSVPFIVTIENQEDVILKSDAPSIGFKFKEADGETVTIQENELWPILSNGETRALYLLNIIFEVEARKDAKLETLFVVDDIADSFDYKNKYAIVEYLNDISKEPCFYQIILTHNFDFYRTVCSRLDIPRENKFHTVKTLTTTRLVEEKYQKNPFSHWKDNLNKDEMLVASIPFVRNLAEYCGFPEHFTTLTALLHLKPSTDSVTVATLEGIIKDILKDKAGLSLTNGDRTIKQLIYELSANILAETQEVIELEKKIVLSIAIRLKTEEFLVKEIDDAAFLAGITRNQTITLIKKFKEKFPDKKEKIELAEQVNLMTPENIHINSFMYEPILDMSNDHLKQLYRKVCAI